MDSEGHGQWTQKGPTSDAAPLTALPGYDYALGGAYFVTICTQDRSCWLADTRSGAMTPTVAGQVVTQTWDSLPARFPFIELDAFVVMPNHIHGILLFADGLLGENLRMSASLGQVMRAFKAASTRLVRKAGLADFAWQRDYYDRVVRNESELQRIREYIAANPTRWGEDPENPASPNLGVAEYDELYEAGTAD